MQVKDAFLISYTAASSRLNGLNHHEESEQLRDWARFALASHLELDTARLRDAAFDTLAVRDPGLADLARQPTGPGRSLFDGNGVLHVLVPHDDPHRSRTVGLLLDQHRADAGADPDRVRVHRYELDRDTHTIAVTSDPPAPTGDVRAAHGYLTMRVDQNQGLTDFLARSRYLSQLELRGTEIWASGWSWPDASGAALDDEDVSVLQRGYLSSELPGFSLDPQPVKTRDDLLAVLPSLNPRLADRILAGAAGELVEPLQKALLYDEPLPEAVSQQGKALDRSQLFSLLAAVEGRPAYSQARYDGLLAGTEIGMTLFYVDNIAKDWVSGVGSGVPTQAVGGFVADPDATTPLSHCDVTGTHAESGRLWFGQADTGFSVAADRISIGAQATRLFARSDGAGGAEIERSYAFGRGLEWWDRHYQAVADFEGQYRRLEQIMRWSGALEWLVGKNSARLPQLPDSAIRSDRRFADWYAGNNELRERAPIQWVTPPSAQQEALRSTPSKSHPYCGLQRIAGGVSLSDLNTRKGVRDFQPDLPGPIRRSGLIDESSRFDPATGSGRVSHVSIDDAGTVTGGVERRLSNTPEGHAVVDVTAPASRAESLGELKVLRGANEPRQLRVGLSADRGTVRQDVSIQGQQLGELVAHKPSRALVAVQWVRGAVDRALGLFRQRDRSEALVSGKLPNGPVIHQVAEGKWLLLDKLESPSDGLAFRVGHPDGTASQALFTTGPELGTGWLSVSRATAESPALLERTGAPGKEARTITVNTLDGKSGTVKFDGRAVYTAGNNPLLGSGDGVAFIALLRDFHPRVANAIRGPPADRSLLQGVRLGSDAAALVAPRAVTVIRAGHPFYSRVLRAIGADGPARPLFTFDGKNLNHVAVIDQAVRHAEGRMDLAEIAPYAGEPTTPMFLHGGQLGVAPLEQGFVFTNPVPRGIRVIVRQIREADLPVRSLAPPQIHRYRGAEWIHVMSGFRFDNGGGGDGGNGGGGGDGGDAGRPRLPIPIPVQVPSSTSPTTPTGPGGTAAPRSDRFILLVCIDTDAKPAGCGS